MTKRSHRANEAVNSGKEERYDMVLTVEGGEKMETLKDIEGKGRYLTKGIDVKLDK